MRSKSSELMQQIVEIIDGEYMDSGRSPTMQEIADKLGISKACVSNYITEMRKRGLVESDGSSRSIRTRKMTKLRQGIAYVPIVGSIACGTPMFAEENIESYVPLPLDIFGADDYFLLRAYGDSMINADISDGDLVLVHRQETAEEGQIIVALIDNETTLKRFYKDGKRKKIILRPENDSMEDMLFDCVNIQGVAVKVIKDLH